MYLQIIHSKGRTTFRLYLTNSTYWKSVLLEIIHRLIRYIEQLILDCSSSQHRRKDVS